MGDATMSPSDWDILQKVTSCLVNVTILIAAVVAAVKFRLFSLFSHRWRSELSCTHHDLGGGPVVFLADYAVHNIGERPISLTCVNLRLVAATSRDMLLAPDEDRELARRTIRAMELGKGGAHTILAGERTTFTLRCRLDGLDDVVFVICDFACGHARLPTSYTELYVKAQQRKP